MMNERSRNINDEKEDEMKRGVSKKKGKKWKNEK